MNTTFSDLITDEYEFYCGRKNISSNKVKKENVYTVVIKKDSVESHYFIEDYNKAVTLIKNQVK
tara:strand:+ start:401 stop:592 length:192 start_codon:yes stop_codon:yes gene_type:complete